jgi:hypothetical protein
MACLWPTLSSQPRTAQLSRSCLKNGMPKPVLRRACWSSLELLPLPILLAFDRSLTDKLCDVCTPP